MYKIDYKYLDCIIKIELTGEISIDEAIQLAKELTNKRQQKKKINPYRC